MLYIEHLKIIQDNTVQGESDAGFENFFQHIQGAPLTARMKGRVSSMTAVSDATVLLGTQGDYVRQTLMNVL